MVPTDVVVALPAGTYGRIAPRSGLALKHGIDVGAGVIDPDYRGNVGILLFNFSDTDFAGFISILPVVFSSYFLSYIRAFLYYIFILYQSKLEIGWRSWFASASRRQTWRRWRRSTRRHAAPTVMAPPVLTDRKLAFSWIHLTCDSRQCLRSLSFWFVHSFFLSLDNSDFHYVLDLSQCLPFAFFLSYVYIAGPRITKPLLNDTHLSDIAVTFILMFWCFYFTR